MREERLLNQLKEIMIADANARKSNDECLIAYYQKYYKTDSLFLIHHDEYCPKPQTIYRAIRRVKALYPYLKADTGRKEYEKNKYIDIAQSVHERPR